MNDLFEDFMAWLQNKDLLQYSRDLRLWGTRIKSLPDEEILQRLDKNFACFCAGYRLAQEKLG